MRCQAANLEEKNQHRSDRTGKAYFEERPPHLEEVKGIEQLIDAKRGKACLGVALLSGCAILSSVLLRRASSTGTRKRENAMSSRLIATVLSVLLIVSSGTAFGMGESHRVDGTELAPSSAQTETALVHLSRSLEALSKRIRMFLRSQTLGQLKATGTSRSCQSLLEIHATPV